MSFYGNITNLSPAQFVFDKIYNSRVEMEADKENFFPGRFALVRYSDDFVASYNADKNTYEEIDTDFDSNNGYDSTIWQKDYSNNFVLIAALKGRIPELEFFTLAPSENASAAVIKKDDVDKKYDFYIPGHWKLKIDENGYNINAAGANKQYRNKDEENEDELKIIQVASGLNDIEYYNSEGNKITNPQDTLEVKLNFPSLGNMVCDGYDLIYGYNENNQMRPLDTQWYDGTEVEKSKNGDSLIGGKTYDLNTVAGSLNTIHNRLGQIIIEKTGNYVLDDLSENFIYKIGDKYYRKGIIYEEDDNVGLFGYEKVENLMESEFQQNKYYQKTTSSGDYEVATSYNADLASNENPSLGYFIKKINGIRYQAKILIPYEQNTYYLKEGEEKYLLDMSENTPSNLTRKYYSINPGEPISILENLFVPGIYWEKDEDNNYIKSYEWNAEKDYYLITASQLTTAFYLPETYYYQNPNNENEYILDTNLNMTQDRQYYIKKKLYVVKDEYGNCPYGYEWSDYSTYIPPSITLCTRTEKPGLIELKGFADGGESSINGILLHLHTLYNTANEGVRDTSSLNGALNSIKDILYQIKDLKPGHILEVNDFGQITSTEYTVKDLINIQDLTELSENFEEYERNYNALSNKIDNMGSSYVTVGQKEGTILGNAATAEGIDTEASGICSHAEGYNTKARGEYSHTEGDNSTASGSYGSHAEGVGTTASGNYGSHAEGNMTTASGIYGSHAEGTRTTASGNSSHSEGSQTKAIGLNSHAEGFDTAATRKSQHVFGEYNIVDTQGSDEDSKGQYIEIVGNGTASDDRSNARTLDWDGNERLAGTLTVGADPVNDMDVVTKQYVDALETRIAYLEEIIRKSINN